MCLFMATETLTKTRRVGRMVLKELEGQQGLNATKRLCMHVWNSQIKIHLKIHAVPIHECLLHPMIPLTRAGRQALFTSALVRIAAFVSLSLWVFLRGESTYSAPILQNVLAETGGPTSSSSCDSFKGPFRVSWKRIFFIFLYCRLSNSRTASFVLCMRSMRTRGGRSLRMKSCWLTGEET